MDSLFGLFILVAIFALSSSSKKKKARKASAAQPVQAPKPQNIPFTKAEFEAYLRKQGAKLTAEPAPEQSAPAASPAQGMHPQVLAHDEPEGTVSTQGESAAEHDGHRRRILAEEAEHMEAHAAAQELRRMNREKLRAAVVMREILDKPVSLRPRGYR